MRLPLFLLAVMGAVAACSSETGRSSPPPAATPAPPASGPAPPASGPAPPASGPAPTPPPDFTAVDTAVTNAALDDIVLIIGDETGVVHVVEKGVRRRDEIMRVASASKLVTGLTLWTLIESGDLAADDAPQDYFPYWTDAEPARRSAVTLDQLLGFVSGFNNPPSEPGCIGRGAILLFDCVQSIYNGDIDTAPGAGFYYGPEHLQIAASMAAEAVGRDFRDVMRTRVFDPLGVSGLTDWPALSGDNPRFSGALRSSADDYGLILQAILSGAAVADREGYLTDRTANAEIVSAPAELEAAGLDWRYGAGFWIECDAPVFEASCAVAPTISSPGAFGFTPWIDFENGYWALLAINESASQTFSPTAFSVALEQELQPLIEQAFNGG